MAEAGSAPSLWTSMAGKRSSVSEDQQLDDSRSKRAKANHAETVVAGGAAAENADFGDGLTEPPSDVPALAADAPNLVPTSIQGHGIADDGAAGNTTFADLETDGGNPLAFETPNVDFSSAPSDPVELALWVAQQISHFQQPGFDSNAHLEEQESGSNSPILSPDPSPDNADPERALELARQRLENRERKKRWRESNAVRSMFTSTDIVTRADHVSPAHLDKDNDLRCRINKRAKQLWGSQQSAGRYAWMEAEFNKRRAKRESKDRGRSLDDDLEGPAQNASLGDTLFPSPGTGPQGETNAAGLLLANALLGAGNGQGPTTEAAMALKSALEKGTVGPESFMEALRAMAANADIIGGINALLEQTSSLDDQAMSSEDALATDQPLAAQAGQATRDAEDATAQDNVDENAIVKALNAATAMLNQINDAQQNNKILDQTGGEAGASANQDASLTASEPANDVTENEDSANLGQAGTSVQPSNDVSAALQQIVQVLSQAGGSDNQAADDTAGFDQSQGAPLPQEPSSLATAVNHSAFGVSGHPALALSCLLQYAGTPVNTIIPAAQGQATSQLYSQFLGRQLQPSVGASPDMNGGNGTSSRQVNHTHAQHAAGSLPVPRQDQGSSLPSNTPHAPPPPSFFSGPVRGTNTNQQLGLVDGLPYTSQRPRPQRDPELEAKIRSFGYPPLPGQKIVIKRRK